MYEIYKIIIIITYIKLIPFYSRMNVDHYSIRFDTEYLQLQAFDILKL